MGGLPKASLSDNFEVYPIGVSNVLLLAPFNY